MKTLYKNRQAYHEYHIEDTLTAGLVLEGWEVKALLASQATFNGGGAFVRLKDGEAWLEAMTIQPLAQAAKGLLTPLNPTRSRKLLLKRSELEKLTKKVAERGYTIVPLEILQDRKLKVSIGLAKGKKQHDKRDAIKTRDVERDLRRAEKNA